MKMDAAKHNMTPDDPLAATDDVLEAGDDEDDEKEDEEDEEGTIG